MINLVEQQYALCSAFTIYLKFLTTGTQYDELLSFILSKPVVVWNNLASSVVILRFFDFLCKQSFLQFVVLWIHKMHYCILYIAIPTGSS